MKRALLVLSALVGLVALPIARADILPPAPGGGYSLLPPTTGYDLPLHLGGYVSPADTSISYGGAVRLDSVFHYGFSSSYAPPAPGVTDTHTFGSLLELSGAGNIGGGMWFPFTLSGVPNTTSVRITGTMGLPGDYSTEMVGLNLTAYTPFGTVMIRESPTLASTGHTTLTPVLGGYQIDSFFDIYTELSLDDGMTWMPADSVERVDYTCIPEPPSTALLAIGMTGLLLMYRRSRKV
jgi:hypothetical protein